MLGFSVALRPDVLWYGFLGCLVGTLVGVLPGIGPLSGISILLPITFGLDATKAIVMLAGIYYGSQYGGSTTSILMRIPGEASSVMTCIDGYAMARKGRAGAALCIAAVGSWIAGTFGVVMLTVIAPPLAAFALRFGPPEYTALLVLGLIFLAYMSSTSLPRTLLMAAVGLLLGTIVIDNLTGHFRYSFDIVELGDGIGIVPVAVGLFGLGEILSTPSATVVGEVMAPKLRELLPNRKEWRQSGWPIARGSILGFLIGLTPGSAHIISSFLSYTVNNSIVDVWIMLIMGVLGYVLRKLGLDPAPLVLGLVISPTFELSLRQSLIMSNGNWAIFFGRPISLVLIAFAAVVLVLALVSAIRKRADWRAKLAEAEAGEG